MIKGFKYDKNVRLAYIDIHIDSYSRTQTVNVETFIGCDTAFANTYDIFDETSKLINKEVIIEYLGKEYKCVLTDLTFFADSQKLVMKFWDFSMEFTPFFVN